MFNPNGDILIFFYSSLCNDLSDNLIEMRIMKYLIATKSMRIFFLNIKFFQLKQLLSNVLVS